MELFESNLGPLVFAFELTLGCLQYVSKIQVHYRTLPRIHVDKPTRSNPLSRKAKQQKGVRCRMFNLIAEMGFESRRARSRQSRAVAERREELPAEMETDDDHLCESLRSG